MCFSSTASLTTAAFLTVVGALSLYKVIRQHKDSTWLMLASIPGFFAIQQYAEGIVWLTINEAPQTVLHTASTNLYFFFAVMFWPIWMPLTLHVLEKDPLRKKILLGSLFAGAASLWPVFNQLCVAPVTVQDINHHLVYNFVGAAWMVHATLYLLAVLVPFFVTSIRWLWIFGVAASVALIASYWFWYEATGSLWCFFAALLSSFILWIISTHQE